MFILDINAENAKQKVRQSGTGLIRCLQTTVEATLGYHGPRLPLPLVTVALGYHGPWRRCPW